MTLDKLLFITVKWIKIYAINHMVRLIQLLLTTEEVNTQVFLSFLHLPSHLIHGLLQYSKSIKCTIKIHNFTTHSNEHSSQKNPHFLFHFLSLHQRRMKIYSFKLKSIFWNSLWIKITSHTSSRLLWLYDLSYFLSIIARQFLIAIYTNVLISSQSSYLSLQLLYSVL